jgi:hypothetical protein
VEFVERKITITRKFFLTFRLPSSPALLPQGIPAIQHGGKNLQFFSHSPRDPGASQLRDYAFSVNIATGNVRDHRQG